MNNSLDIFLSVSGNVMINDVLAEAGTNMSIGCPGVTRNTFVVQLEWRCIGQCGKTEAYKSMSVGPSQMDDVNGAVRLLKYVKDQQTTLEDPKSRIRLDQEMFGLEFDPVTAKDQGKYICLINNRPLPDAVIQLSVLGKQRKSLWMAFLALDAKSLWPSPQI